MRYHFDVITHRLRVDHGRAVSHKDKHGDLDIEREMNYAGKAKERKKEIT